MHMVTFKRLTKVIIDEDLYTRRLMIVNLNLGAHKFNFYLHISQEFGHVSKIQL